MRPSFLIGLILAVSSAGMASAAPAPTAPPPAVTKDGVEVIILPTLAPATGPETVIQATLDVEARSDDAAKRLGFRSLRAVTSVDCKSGDNKFIIAEVHDQSDLQGTASAGRVSGQWVHPTPDSFMFEATQKICAGVAAPPAPAPVVTAPMVTAAASPAPAAPPSPKPAKPAKPPKHTPPPLPVVTAAATPMVTATPAPKPPPPSPPPPAPTPPPARPAAAPVVAAARTVAPAASRPGPVVAQVAASPTAAQAQRLLDALKSLIVPPLAGHVEAAEVKGVKVFRASVTGFASTEEARAFCAKAASRSKTCWVRPPPSAGKSSAASESLRARIR